MSNHPLDDPQILMFLFHPSRAAMHNALPDVYSGVIPVEGDIGVGYRLYLRTEDAPLVIFFHGNGEVASDYDGLYTEFQRAGASLLVIDYRGYGWSTGQPLTSKLLPDAEAAVKALPEILKSIGVSGRYWFVMGRSLGSAPAIHLASVMPERFKGLIIESGFAEMPSVLRRIGVPPEVLRRLPADSPIGNDKKMASIELPLLVIHGQHDMLLPLENGQALYNASPAADKQLVIIPRAGHNDLLFYGMSQYFGALQDFIARHST